MFLYDLIFTYRDRYPALERSSFPKANIASFIAWLCSIAVSYCVPWGLSIVNAVVTAFVVKLLFDKVFKLNNAVKAAD